MPEEEPGVVVKLSDIWEIVRKLEHLPEQLKAIEARLESGMEGQERIIVDVRDELRREVQVRNERLDSHEARLSSLEASRTASAAAEAAASREQSSKTPWTGIVAIIVSGLVAAITFIKEIAN